MDADDGRCASDGDGLQVAFGWVDVFASRPLEGNPLPVILDADALPESTMRAIARELGQSETTFVCRPSASGATVRLRSFTPTGTEVTGAGHNALGAWWWLVAEGRIDHRDTGLAQQLGDEVWPVRLIGEERLEQVAMTQGPPDFGSELRDPRALAAALGAPVAVRSAQVVSTGAAHLLVQLDDRPAVDSVTPDAAALRTILADVGGQGCYVWSTDPGDSGTDAYARFFNPTVGIVEDPATGSAAGPLAAQLARARGTSHAVEIAVAQGRTTGRPSVLTIRVDGDHLELIGACACVGRGRLDLPHQARG